MTNYLSTDNKLANQQKKVLKRLKRKSEKQRKLKSILESVKLRKRKKNNLKLKSGHLAVKKQAKKPQSQNVPKK